MEQEYTTEKQEFMKEINDLQSSISSQQHMEKQLFEDLEAAREELQRLNQCNQEDGSNNVLEESEQTKEDGNEKRNTRE